MELYDCGKFDDVRIYAQINVIGDVKFNRTDYTNYLISQYRQWIINKIVTMMYNLNGNNRELYVKQVLKKVILLIRKQNVVISLRYCK